MTLIIRQLVIRGEVVEDTARYGGEQPLNLEQVKELIDAAKKEMEREYQEKISQMLDYSVSR
ncbi:DUF5908 family protein [Algoriphagus sp.]|uniref:DUF5908 family protein n=1 Tax=Algoriphagus sp. TaxID=1872435 RepID=UPI002624EA8E|nr:DUF5908 family protein [Algoriphagus sp.]